MYKENNRANVVKFYKLGYLGKGYIRVIYISKFSLNMKLIQTKKLKQKTFFKHSSMCIYTDVCVVFF